jgi:chromosome partitioning protein
VIITVVNLKGGVAKTTTAVLLATCAAEDLSPAPGVTLFDLDPESSAYGWNQLADNALPFDVIALPSEDRLRSRVRPLYERGQTVIIDTPPNSRDILMASALAAHVAIVPVTTTATDVARLQRTVDVLLEVADARDGQLRVEVLLTRYNQNTKMSQAALTVLSDYPLIPKRIRDLEKYKRMHGTVPTYLAEYREVWTHLKRVVRPEVVVT